MPTYDATLDNSPITRIMPVTATGASSIDTAGNMPVSLGTKLAGEDLTNDVIKVVPRTTYVHITTATTTVINTGPGTLATIDFTTVSNGVITIYDNTAASGTVIRLITNPAAPLQNEINKTCNWQFSTGLTIVTSAAIDLTIGYTLR